MLLSQTESGQQEHRWSPRACKQALTGIANGIRVRLGGAKRPAAGFHPIDQMPLVAEPARD